MSAYIECRKPVKDGQQGKTNKPDHTIINPTQTKQIPSNLRLMQFRCHDGNAGRQARNVQTMTMRMMMMMMDAFLPSKQTNQPSKQANNKKKQLTFMVCEAAPFDDDVRIGSHGTARHGTAHRH